MTALLSILTSGAFGSALGSLFQWLNRKTEIAAKKMEYDHDEKMADLQNQQALALADKAIDDEHVQHEYDTVLRLSVAPKARSGR